jgi:hypothetical protein
MIPAIYGAQALTGVDEHVAVAVAVAAARVKGRRDAASAIGICSAVGAFGGVLIQQPDLHREHQEHQPGPGRPGPCSTGSAGCCYLRRRMATQLVPSLAGAGV